MAGKKHQHKYYFGMLVGNQPVWACALEGCSHYMPNHIKNILNGKYAICWKCEGTAVIDFSRMKEYPEGKVWCNDCLVLRQAALIKSNEVKGDTPEIESHVEGINICKKCAQHPALPSNPNGWCVRCAYLNI